MTIIKKEIKLDTRNLIEKLEWCLRNNLSDWGEISEDDAYYVTDRESGNFDLLMNEIGKEIINKYARNREE